MAAAKTQPSPSPNPPAEADDEDVKEPAMQASRSTIPLARKLAASKSVDQVYSAIVAAQKAAGIMLKDKKLPHNSAPFIRCDAMIQEAKDILTDNNLAAIPVSFEMFEPSHIVKEKPIDAGPQYTGEHYFQPFAYRGAWTRTYLRIVHSSGQWFEAGPFDWPAVPNSKARDIGTSQATAATFRLGYALRDLLCIARMSPDEAKAYNIDEQIAVNEAAAAAKKTTTVTVRPSEKKAPEKTSEEKKEDKKEEKRIVISNGEPKDVPPAAAKEAPAPAKEAPAPAKEAPAPAKEAPAPVPAAKQLDAKQIGDELIKIVAGDADVFDDAVATKMIERIRAAKAYVLKGLDSKNPEHEAEIRRVAAQFTADLNRHAGVNVVNIEQGGIVKRLLTNGVCKVLSNNFVNPLIGA